MLDHKSLLVRLVEGVRKSAAVTVRETNFGYVIRSENCGSDCILRKRIIKVSVLALAVATVGVWLMPMSITVKAGLSVVLLAAGYALMVFAKRSAAGIELHVDTSRRELRSAVVTAKGESWIRSSARFGEVSGPILRRGKTEANRHSLGLRIAGETEDMPVAVGDEDTLLAVHHRLLRDLRPIEERLAGFALNDAPVRSSGREVFPQLGPDEAAA